MGLLSFELISIIEIRPIFYDREGITDKTDRSVTEITEKSRTGPAIRTSFKSWTGPDRTRTNLILKIWIKKISDPWLEFFGAET